MNIDKKTLGQRIKSIRQSKGLTMEEFGKFFDNASKGVISNWEKGSNIPNNARLKMIAQFGGISVNELLYGDFKSFCFNLFDETIAELKENDPGFDDSTFNEGIAKEYFFKEMYTRMKSHGYSYDNESDIKYIFRIYLPEASNILIGTDSKKAIEFVERKLNLFISEVRNIFKYPVALNKKYPGILSYEDRKNVNSDLYDDINEILLNARKEIDLLKNKYNK